MSVARGMRPLGGMPMRWRGARIRRDWAYADLEHGGEDRFEDKGAVLGSERGQICDEHCSDLRAVARRTGRWCGVLSQWVAQGGAKASPPPPPHALHHTSGEGCGHGCGEGGGGTSWARLWWKLEGNADAKLDAREVGGVVVIAR